MKDTTEVCEVDGFGRIALQIIIKNTP